MTTNIRKLKKGKGAPPEADQTPDVMTLDMRSRSDEATPQAQTTRPLQVRIPLDVFEAFSEQAGREFGFTHGAKKQLFLKIWAVYKSKL